MSWVGVSEDGSLSNGHLLMEKYGDQGLWRLARASRLIAGVEKDWLLR